MRKRYGDHPRVCGEKQTIVGEYGPELGSPPRVRGKVELHHQDQTHVGITPACAGKSWTALRGTEKRGDHPRVCGEKLLILGRQLLHLGSPPRVRGKGRGRGMALAHHGITPACAGKRQWFSLGVFIASDHPRVCGEKWPCVKSFHEIHGSPPRVRGKDFLDAFFVSPFRITPACAGKRLMA